MRSLISLFTVSLVLAVDAFSPFAKTHHKRNNAVEQHEECDSRGAVASESAVCSRIGIELIKEGGNAADAVCEIIDSCRESCSMVAFADLVALINSLSELYSAWA